MYNEHLVISITGNSVLFSLVFQCYGVGYIPSSEPHPPFVSRYLCFLMDGHLSAISLYPKRSLYLSMSPKKSGLQNISTVDSLSKRTNLLRSRLLWMSLFFLLKRRICLVVFSLDSRPWYLSFNRRNESACDSRYESDRSDSYSLIFDLLACRVAKVFLSFFTYLYRCLIPVLIYSLDLEFSSPSSFFFLLLGQL